MLGLAPIDKSQNGKNRIDNNWLIDGYKVIYGVCVAISCGHIGSIDLKDRFLIKMVFKSVMN